ncbi:MULTISPECIES: efflux RND transporter periplasmic adaptor subunit [Sphingomonadaceae]|jgi:multidrug efflux system membrane fusion protein|uniref:efflux RND transporter periplasmic adaptor subunit n=1 Tax=Sphingomonadales TaxID=204457 RepID=UPI000A35D6B3|nr:MULTISPECIES: membrane fusion protein MtrC [Sphingomonadaceae]OUC52908.1 membrane fusion protein MtrC [Sphingobium sp. GW456-12-10-14-TSB1]QCI92954.1 efflux RND transporter periplasmic adaptor subunit [Novosphingobium sp. EMRT-2]
MRQIILIAPILLAGCGSDPSQPAAPPAHAETIAHETELLKLTLTPQAQQRLGIGLARVGGGSASAVRQVAGEIVVPPTSANGVPVNSTTNLQQIGSQQAAADAELARATAQARLARIALNRAEGLVREEAGSIRARDEAAAALAAAQAALGAARQQRQLLGPSVASLGSQSTLWVRASVFGSDVGSVRRDGAATIRPLGNGGTPRAARPVQAPPSANTSAGTVDLYFAVDNRDRAFRIGQRVSVDLPLTGQTEGLSVPSAALLRDIYGGEWVYQKTAANTFVRQRVEVASERDGRALLARGLIPGAEVVTTGAAELFGTEFGAAH